MGHAHHEDQEAPLMDGVHNNVILARMNAAKPRMALKLLRPDSTRIVRQERNPPRDAILDGLRQMPQLVGRLRGELDVVSHGLEP